MVVGPTLCITRSKDRVRIETLPPDTPYAIDARITRSKDRVRIETSRPCRQTRQRYASPGRKTGCGLKLEIAAADGHRAMHHPVERPGAD